MLPDLVLSGLLVIGELLRVAAAGPEAAQARRTGMHTCTCMCSCACDACNDALTWCLHGADVGAGGVALPAAWRAGGRRAAGGGRRRIWEERLSAGAVLGLAMKFWWFLPCREFVYALTPHAVTAL